MSEEMQRLWKAFDSMYRELTFKRDPRATEIAKKWSEITDILPDYDYKPTDNKVNKTTIYEDRHQ